MKRKKILYIHQYFFHPKEPGPTRVYWISQELINQGFEVTVITQKNPNNPIHKIIRSVEKTKIDGINIIYIKNPYSMEFSKHRRLWAFFKFMIKSTWFALIEKETSLIIASSTPLSTGFPAIIAKKLKRIPFIFEVRDLWPEVPIQMGVLKNKLFIGLLRWFERLVYKNASHIVALSPGMAEGPKSVVSENKISIIPNMSKIDKFWPRTKNIDFGLSLDLSPNTFKIIHFGAMGDVNGLDNLVDAAALSIKKNIKNIDFILIGGGKRKIHYQERKKSEKLFNLHILDRLPMNQISELVNLCDICYIGVSRFPILEINSANKFFDSLSAGKPLIINFGGWMQEIIEKANCGIRVKPTDPEDLLEKILFLQKNQETRQKMGKNARKIAEKEFDKSILCKNFAQLVHKIS